jgi:hypothetical protein
MTARILCRDCIGDLARAILIERLVGYDANTIASVAYQLMRYGLARMAPPEREEALRRLPAALAAARFGRSVEHLS